MAEGNDGYYYKNDSGLGMGEVDFLTKVNSADRFKMDECSGEICRCPGNCPDNVQPNFTRNMFKHLYESYKRGEFVDATLRTQDGGCFYVHRIALCGESEYFRALFASSLNSKEKTDFLIREVSSELMEMIIHFMYAHEVCLNCENITKILRLADYFGIIPLKDLCCDYLLEHLNSKNVVGIYQFADDNFCMEMKTKAKDFMLKNFTEVAQYSKEILELPITELVSIFGNEKLNVKNEEIVWLAAVRWIEHKPEERMKHVAKLLKEIRTGLMDTNFFIENVQEHPFVVGNIEVRPRILETLRFLYDLEISLPPGGGDYIPFANSELAKPRLPNEIIFAIGGWRDGAPSNSIESYDARADRWSELPFEHLDPLARAYHGTVALGHEIILIGGFDGITCFNSVRAFNAVTKKWKYLAPMSERRCYVAVAKYDSNFIYVFGGYDGQNRLNTCERYDRKQNQWAQLTPMNCQRSDASATSYNGKMYVVGGYSGSECLSCAEVYNPTTNQWSYIPSMRNKRSGVSCIAYHDCIYVIGGFNGIIRLNTAEKYNPITCTWSPISDMWNPRSNFACAIVDDMLFTVGGYNGFSTIPNVECYDAKTDEWYEATDLNIFRSALSCCVVSDLPNIKDYVHGQREFLMEERRQRLMSIGPFQIPLADELQPPLD